MNALAVGLVKAGRYLKAVMGDNAYEVYLAHLAAAHPGTPPMLERLFWRERDDEQDRNLQCRCC
ncbi:YbdD/YjiX family protein [Mycetocola sp.]|uniref:YbdD/YjiX family protein n=1 Tax=Mycetocola sp. TaxID=1871042 RepID=UPI00398A1C71